MEYEKITLVKADGIGFVTLSDPASKNAISGKIVDELTQCIDECEDDPDVRVVVMRGAGDAFSAGGNVKIMKERIDAGRFNEYGPGLRKLGALITKIRHVRKPVIASVHGAAAGGGLNLALACDFRVAAENAKFTFAFVNIGLIPDCGGPFMIIKMLGVAKATELLMTGKLFSGRDAYVYGLVNEAVPQDKLEEATLKLARKLAKGPTLAYGMIKTMINRIAFSGLDLELDNELEYQKLCAVTEDHKEGINAFLEKRKPVFRGR
jgi:Enoyl-CoA hydratase/carnithine racemase